MRILLSSYFALPNTGGLWTYVTQLRQGLEARGHEVDILAHHPDVQHFYVIGREPYFQKEPAARLFRKHVLPRYARIRPGLENEILRMELQRYELEAAACALDVSSYDLIHVQDILAARALARVKPPHTPLIATLHGYFTSELLRQGLIRQPDSAHHRYSLAQERIGIASADIAILPSQWMKELFLQDLQVEEKMLRVVPNGMEIPLFLQRLTEEPALQKPAGKKVIACIARLDPIKGHPCLLDALAALKQRADGWVCWLIGEGGARRKIEGQIANLGLQEEVLLLGDRSDVPALLAQADLCVLPSLQENCPYSIMEAQTAGNVVVASEVGGIPEMIRHGETGFLTPPDDCDALCATLEQLLADEALCARVGAAAKAWGRAQWSLDTMLGRTVQLYQEALARKVHAKRRESVKQSLEASLRDLFPARTPSLAPPETWLSELHFPPQHQLPDPAFVRVIRGL